MTDAVHVNGGRIFAQLMHGGRISHPDTTGVQPVAPSAVTDDVATFTTSGMRPIVVPHALTTEEAAREALSYAESARYAIDAGFDGVELHGANGYLISQFLSTNANLRDDRYGGSVANRIRFVVEAVAATVDAVGADRTGVRLSPGGGIQGTVETDAVEVNTALLTELADVDIAYVHLEATLGEEELLKLRNAWPGTMIMNPSNPLGHVPAGQEHAEHWLDLGVDLISFARAFLANPDLVERMRAGLPLAEGDKATFYGGGDEGYLTYPTYRYTA